MREEENVVVNLTSSRSVGMRDIKALLPAPISRIKTLRDDEGRTAKGNVGQVLPDKRELPPRGGRWPVRVDEGGFSRGFTARFVIPQACNAGYSGRSAFTLIELLVVVLIIGILAAIALPQYQLAVNKARFAKLHTLVATYARAAKFYYDMHGAYPNDISETGIELPSNILTTSSADKTCAYDSELYCCINSELQNIGASVTCGQVDLSFALRYGLQGNAKSCIANPNNRNANRLCSSLGTLDGSTRWPSPTGYGRGTRYSLP